jgi:hypothetical protein
MHGDLSVIFFHFKEKILFKNNLIKLDQSVLRRNEVDTYEPTFFYTWL